MARLGLGLAHCFMELGFVHPLVYCREDRRIYGADPAVSSLPAAYVM